jgi:hypothetical protein
MEWWMDVGYGEFIMVIIYIYIAMNYVTMYCELNYVYGLCTLLWTFISYMGYKYIYIIQYIDY